MTGSASYRPGDWFAVFGRHALVVLPPSEKSRVAGIWAMVDEGAGFDEVLDALIADGLRALPGFVLVSDDDGETKVVIRGAARAEFATADDTVVVEGSSKTTWAERSLRDVVSMSIEVADAAGVDLPIADGLVRISRIDRPSVVAGPEPDPEPGPVELADPESTGEGLAAAPEELADETAYDAMTPVPPVPNWSLDPTPVDPDPVEPDSVDPDPFEATPMDDSETTRVEDRDPAADADPSDESDQPSASDEPAPDGAVARLRFSSGEEVEVDQVVVIGRAPDPARSGNPSPVRLVTVVSPHQEISSTHVEFRPGTDDDLGVAVVTDLGSTNGTVLEQPGRPPEDLSPGIRVAVVPGAVVDLGDGVTIRVDQA